MSYRNRINLMLALVVVIFALAAGSADAGYMGFSAESLQYEKSGDC